MRAYVEGIGLLGPGLRGWDESRAVLAGAEPYRPAPTVIPPSDLLPPAERRRAGIPVRLALAVGAQAFRSAGRDAAATATVFTSSSGDGEILHHICDTLTTPERQVSPTRFMNSVHNAAAGYWSIATQSREPSTSLCCYDASFAAGLLECTTQIAVDERPVALIAYDQPYPQPIHAARSISGEFGAALVMTPHATERSLALLELEFMPGDAAETRLPDPGLEAARLGNPAARALPLLALLARVAAEPAILQYTAGASLRARATLCS
ncbi:MAG TPA: beta-ketoacyl synthase chain length factor [Burkholderiales bacterium]|nr:beta-ketoacyl synthase chain length factor [Burkholderiales bacterium]